MRRTSENEMDAYHKGMFQELYSWIIFGIIVTIAWDIGLNAAKTRYENDNNGQAICRRPYIVALCAYALMTAWFYAAFMVVLLLVWCIFLQMTKNSIDLSFWKWLVENLAQTKVVMHCFDECYTWTHLVISIVALVAAGWVVGFYITDEDLTPSTPSLPSTQSDANSPCYRKTLRCLTVIPTIMGVTYVIFAIGQILNSEK